MTFDDPPTRAAALARLRAFTPHMGRAYAAGRNHVRGPDERPAVSRLSPYVRRRLLLEEELIAAAQAAHGADARAFIDEVLWRSYWKGWLQQRPAVWAAYREAARFGRDRLATEGGLRRVFHDAVEGNTGIDCFDAWARDLVAENWLHNHVRMWFASIWIFTLRLPWALGAEFFLRHLIDGDPASNTLSWRWVAGLHTRGKAYVARAENIARFTGGRFNPAGQLDERPEPLHEPADPPPPRLPPPRLPPPRLPPPRLPPPRLPPPRLPPPRLPPPCLPPADDPPQGPVALLLHDEDCLPETLGLGAIAAVGCVSPAPLLTPSGVAPCVAAFARAAVADAAARLGAPMEWLAPGAAAAWIARQGAPVVVAEPQIGPVAEMLGSVEVLRLRRGWDAATWPHATRGFFQMRDRLPDDLTPARPTQHFKA